MFVCSLRVLFVCFRVLLLLSIVYFVCVCCFPLVCFVVCVCMVCCFFCACDVCCFVWGVCLFVVLFVCVASLVLVMLLCWVCVVLHLMVVVCGFDVFCDVLFGV